MAINNPYVPGDPFSYDLKWIVRKIKEHSTSIQEIIDSMPDDATIRSIVQQMLADGTLSTMFLNDLNIVNVKDYGAKGDRLADDHDAIMAAYAKAVELKGVLYFPDGEYMIGSGLLFDDPVHVIMLGSIYYPGNATAVTVGQSGASTGFIHQNWKIEGISGINAGSVGLRLINCEGCSISLEWINNFETCVVCEGDDEGFENNVVMVDFIGRYTYGMILNSAGSGWCNENLFIGGRFFKSSSAYWNTAALIITSDGSRYQNNNVFIKPNFESNDSAIILDYANFNKVISARFENVTDPVTVNNASQNNEIDGGFGLMYNIPETNSQTIPQLYGRINSTPTEIVFGDFAARYACNASNGSIEDFYIMTNNGAKNHYLAGFTFAPDGNDVVIPAGRLFGCLVPIETDGTHVFHIDAITKEQTERGMFQMLDANGSVITTPPGFFSAQTANNQTFGSTSAFLFTNSPDGYNFIPPAECKTLFVGIYTTADVTLKRIRLYSTARYYVQKRKATLPAIPTNTGNSVGQTAIEFQGTSEWVWNGTAWKTITMA